VGDAAQDGGYLGSAHVLALVPVCVAHSVDEIDETVSIRLQQVAGAEPAVATLYKVEAIKVN
jgi:hypothetical protein